MATRTQSIQPVVSHCHILMTAAWRHIRCSPQATRWGRGRVRAHAAAAATAKTSECS